VGQPLFHAKKQDEPGHDQDPAAHAEEAGQASGQDADADRGEASRVGPRTLANRCVVSHLIEYGPTVSFGREAGRALRAPS
jgi:hypothetical protein